MRRHLRSHKPDHYAVDDRHMDPLSDYTQPGPVAGPSMHVEEEGLEGSHEIVLKAPYKVSSKLPDIREEDSFQG